MPEVRRQEGQQCDGKKQNSEWNDGKRVHVFHEMRRDGEPVATAEQMLLHVDTVANRAAETEGEVARRGEELAAAHAGLPRPERAGRAIGVRPPA